MLGRFELGSDRETMGCSNRRGLTSSNEAGIASLPVSHVASHLIS
jgi:hypothetical protein